MTVDSGQKYDPVPEKGEGVNVMLKPDPKDMDTWCGFTVIVGVIVVIVSVVSAGATALIMA